MASSHPGTGGLWKNYSASGTNKQPNFKGEITLPDGTHITLSGWETEGIGRRPTISMRVNKVTPPTKAPPPPPAVKPDNLDNFIDNAEEPTF